MAAVKEIDVLKAILAVLERAYPESERTEETRKPKPKFDDITP